MIAWADGRGFAGVVGDPYIGPYQDYHYPDWSPDGRTIAARFGLDEDVFFPSGVSVYDAATGDPVNRIGPCGIMTEPSFSPDRTYVVLTSRTFADVDGTELTEPRLCVMRADNTALAFMVDAPASDAAWSPVPGSAPPIPGPDTTPPTVELAFTPELGPSGWFSSAPVVDVSATDNVGVSSIRCTYDGQWIGPYEFVLIDHGLSGQVSLYGQGEHALACMATDLSENTGIVSRAIQIGEPPPPDTTAPWVQPFSFSANPIPVGETSVVTEVAWDDQSGIAGGDVTVSDQPPVPMALTGSTLTAEIGPGFPADLYLVSVRVRDAAGNAASPNPQILVIYGPPAGSAGGTGWIVPGGSSSEPGDVLPGMDGTSKASFAFTSKYKSATSPIPSGKLNFSYGSLFKLQSTSLAWLVVRDAERAYIGGTATISGTDGEVPFVATVRDGSATGGSDRFVIKVYAPGANPAVDGPLFQASGDAGGQIQIQG